MRLGIKKISVTKQKNIQLPFLTETEIIKLLAQIEWVEIPITNTSGTFDETSNYDKNGQVRSVTIKAVIVDTTGKVRNSLRKIEKNHVFLVEDMNGIKYLVGTNHFRSDLKYSHEIGKLDKNIFTIEIEHKSPHGALRLKPQEQYLFWRLVADSNITKYLSLMFGSFEMQAGERTTTEIKVYGVPDWIFINDEKYPDGIRYLPKSEWAISPTVGELNVVFYIIAQENTTGKRREANITIEQIKSGKRVQILLSQNP